MLFRSLYICLAKSCLSLSNVVGWVWTWYYSIVSSKTKNVQRMTEMGRYMDVNIHPARKVRICCCRLFTTVSRSWSAICFWWKPLCSVCRYAWRRWLCPRRRRRTVLPTRQCEWSESTVFAFQIHPVTLHQSALIWRWVERIKYQSLQYAVLNLVGDV